MTQEILDYARGGGDFQPAETRVDTLIGQVCAFFEHDFEDRRLDFQCQLDYAGPLLLDVSKIRRALYNICEDHGGTIGVKSAPGQGATFIIRLPRTQSAA